MQDEFKRFEVQPFRPDRNKFGIYMPQSCRGLAHGPSQQIHYITALVGPCVAVALTGCAKGQSYPMVEFGHLDGVSGPKTTAAELVYCAQQDFVGKFSPSKAYLAHGFDYPILYRPILEKLEEAGFECYINVEKSASWLTIDLESGLPVLADINSFHVYVPNREAQPQFLKYATVFPRTPILFPAFDLTKAVPQFYELDKRPFLPGDIPHPR